MAEDGIGTACEHRGQTDAVARNRLMTDRVDASMDPVQPARLSHSGNGVARVFEALELLGRHDPVLSRCQVRQPVV
jgi:poly-beta-hydroxyalkanoate depolymerase